MKLDLGCGPYKKQGYIGVDKFPYPNVDCICDIDKGLPQFKDNSVDEIYTSHFLEHTQNFEFVMEEIWRVMKPHGILEVIVPHWASAGAHSDLHVRFFGYRSFGGFTHDPNSRHWASSKADCASSKADFKIIEDRLVYRTDGISGPYGRLMNWLSNIYPAYFDYWLARFLPPDELYFKLEVLK